jgi:GxxExxY protein
MLVKDNFKYSALTQEIIKEAFYVFNQLGSGFMEKIYENSLILRLMKKGFNIKSQHPINVYFEGELIGEYFADIIVNDKVIIELKAVKEISPIHEVQLVNYLKATGIEVGLLINFGDRVKFKRKVLSKAFKK